MKKTTRNIAMLCALGLVAAAGSGALRAQQTAPAVKRNVLLKQDMATAPGKEAVMALVEIPVGGAEGRHTHPAEVFAFVLDGTLSLEAEGKPTTTLKAGDYFTIMPGQIHNGVNAGAVPVKLSVVFVAEKGKPLTTPVP
ncbi:MAG TPA: cupin domain-containing protein [Thermoanaerobaculia bacterium]